MLGFGRLNESLDASHDSFRKNAVPRTKNLGVVGVNYVLRAEEHLFVELLSRPHPGEAYLDVYADGQAGQPDEIGRDVNDPNRLSHVEQEDLAAAAERA